MSLHGLPIVFGGVLLSLVLAGPAHAQEQPVSPDTTAPTRRPVVESLLQTDKVVHRPFPSLAELSDPVE